MSRAEWTAGLVALGLGILHQWILPNSGTDLAAQLARASFARSAPLTPVDLSWYSGVHPYGYSLLSPWVMATVGVAATGILAAIGGAMLLTRLLREQRFPRTTAVLCAFFAVADIVSGRTTFALAAVALLAAVLLRERRGWAIFFGVLTALLSPVAAFFLGLIAAVLVLHRRPGGWALGFAAMIPTVVLIALFPGGGVQPFPVRSAIPAVLTGAVVALLTRSPMVRTGAVLYAGAVIFFAVHNDPFGSNILRLGLLVAGPLLVATHRHWTPTVMIATAAVLVWQAGPLIADLAAAPGPELARLTAELVALHSARVEIVPPRDHRESWTVAEAVPLARGWSRQIDYRDNQLFYAGSLTGREYLAWLRRHAVDHVAVPRRATVDFGGTREAALLGAPVAGLTHVWSDGDWNVFAVKAPDALVSHPATLLSSTRTSVAFSSPSAGDVQVRVRWSRWLTLSGPGCVDTKAGHVNVHFDSPGVVVLSSSLFPRHHCS